MIKRKKTIVHFTCLLLLIGTGLAAKENAAAPELSVLWVLPFIGILVCIAVIPLINARFWEKNLWWISLLVFCVPMSLIFSIFMGKELRALTFEKGLDYVSFIILLASLFVISGGILIRGSLSGTPVVNAVFLLIGSVTASFIGTTGASMLLVRPLIRANQNREKKAHIIIFFIFLVSNIGGSLTPLGDPPLFLGYLQGVPFEWTFRLIPQWAIACSIVITVFFLMDTFFYKREALSQTAAPVSLSEVRKEISSAVTMLDINKLRANGKIGIGLLNNVRVSLDRAAQGLDRISGKRATDVGLHEKFAINGKINLVLLAGVVIIVFMQGLLMKQVSWWPRFGPQEGGMALLLLLSLLLTPVKSELRQKNGFTFQPIREVALIFAGIFAAMIPALYILEHKGAALGVTQPWQFFWASGGLSSFLDNAPTYLTFLSLANGLNLTKDIVLNDGGGSVFMGANSYIGNGPNFMVKSIAEEQGIKMPSFFGYMAYSILILVPVFIMITFLFFV
jgi:Na+/H+ antiporter NhaD/arsenite permease-like protein